MDSSEEISREIVLSPEHREAVRQNGIVTAGNIRLTVEDTLIYVELLGPRELSAIVYCCLLLEEAWRLRGSIYLLIVDAYGMSPMPPEYRRFLGQWSRKGIINALALVSNGNRTFTTLVGLMVRAFNMLSDAPMSISFFTKESEARAWLDEQCQRTSKHQL